MTYSLPVIDDARSDTKKIIRSSYGCIAVWPQQSVEHWAGDEQLIGNCENLPSYPEDELRNLEFRLRVNWLVLCSWQLLSYSKATVTRQKEYACSH